MKCVRMIFFLLFVCLVAGRSASEKNKNQMSEKLTLINYQMPLRFFLISFYGFVCGIVQNKQNITRKIFGPVEKSHNNLWIQFQAFLFPQSFRFKFVLARFMIIPFDNCFHCAR